MKRTPLRPSRSVMGEKKRGQPRFASSSQKRRILVAQDWLCYYCGGPLDYEGAVIDHLVPWASGGETKEGNLVACHRAENKTKGNRSEAEYRQMGRKGL